MKTRRSFLGESLLAGAAVFSNGCGRSPLPSARLGTDPVQQLRSTFQGDLVFPDNAEEATSMLKWLDETSSVLQSYAGGRVYVNIPGSDDAGVEAEYPDNHTRLIAVKNRYDPENLFRRNYNIRPLTEPNKVSLWPIAW